MRTPINRGFKNPRRVWSVNPVVARPYAGGRTMKGAPLIGARSKITPYQPYPNPPLWFMGPTGEWILYWYFTERKSWQEGKDFYYQAALFAPFLFSSRDFTRVDFLVDFGPTSQAYRIGNFKALALDPITAFTHPDPAFDKRRRAELGEAGYLLIFLETSMLEANPQDVIEKALRGLDVSTRR
jgi:hypothetical protein